MARKRGAARPKKQDVVLREDVRKAIERVWADGTVDMTFDPDESYFNDIHPRLRQAFRRIKGARLIHERAAEGEPRWLEGSDPDENPPDDIELSRSYHLFFICPEGEAFTFETEIENLEERELAEELEEAGWEDNSTPTRVPGYGWTGWSVAVSLLAPFAVISLNEVSLFDDGSTLEPGIETYAQTEEGDQVDLEELYRKVDGEKTFEILQDLRARITGILERHEIAVLPNEEWRKPVSWLRGGDEVFVGAGGEPIRVLDAFFFEEL